MRRRGAAQLQPPYFVILMARARPAAASSSGRPSYAESFASRRRRQARAPANQQTTKNEQGVPHATGCVWRHGLSDVAREETEDNQEDAEEGSCMRHWHNLQKCRDLQNMNLEVIQRALRSTPLCPLPLSFCRSVGQALYVLCRPRCPSNLLCLCPCRGI